LQLHATGGQPPYTWDAAGLPKNLLMDPKSGLITGTVAQAGAHDVTITVTDKAGAKVSQSYKLTVT
jgi:hypothetical protein